MRILYKLVKQCVLHVKRNLEEQAAAAYRKECQRKTDHQASTTPPLKRGTTLSVMCDTLTEHTLVKLEIKGDTHEIFMQYGPQ